MSFDLTDPQRRVLDELVTRVLDTVATHVDAIHLRTVIRSVGTRPERAEIVESLVPRYADRTTDDHFAPTLAGMLASEKGVIVEEWIKALLDFLHAKFTREGGFDGFTWAEVKEKCSLAGWSPTEDRLRRVSNIIHTAGLCGKEFVRAPEEGPFWTRPPDLEDLVDDNVRDAHQLLAFRERQELERVKADTRLPSSTQSVRPVLPAGPAGATTIVNIYGSHVGSVATGHGASANGSVTQGQASAAPGTVPTLPTRLSQNQIDHVELKIAYTKLLDGCFPEQIYRDFLEEYSEFIPREFVQHHGIHLDLVLRNVAFGGEHLSDFVYLSKSSGDWNVILVELERPQCRYFKDNNGSLHPEFLAGLQQINRWRAWFSSQRNRADFLDVTLGFLRVPLKMRENPCRIKYVLVTGRSAEAKDSALKRGLINAQEQDGEFKILSFDSLVHLEKRPSPRYIGVLRGDGLDIVSRRYSGESLFSQVPPDQIRITDELRADCLAHKGEWHTRSLDDDGTVSFADAGRMILDDRLPKLGTCDGPERKQLAAAIAKLGVPLPR